MKSFSDQYIERRDAGGSLHPVKGIPLETVDEKEVVEVIHDGWTWLFHVPQEDHEEFCDWVWVEFGEIDATDPQRIHVESYDGGGVQ